MAHTQRVIPTGPTGPVGSRCGHTRHVRRPPVPSGSDPPAPGSAPPGSAPPYSEGLHGIPRHPGSRPTEVHPTTAASPTRITGAVGRPSARPTQPHHPRPGPLRPRRRPGGNGWATPMSRGGHRPGRAPGAGRQRCWSRCSRKTDESRVVLTVRSDQLRSHQGEVAFPGGRLDTGEDVVEAALREADEEVSLDSSLVTVIGQLTALPTVSSNTVMTPVVAALDRRPVLRANPGRGAPHLRRGPEGVGGRRRVPRGVVVGARSGRPDRISRRRVPGVVLRRGRRDGVGSHGPDTDGADLPGPEGAVPTIAPGPGPRRLTDPDPGWAPTGVGTPPGVTDGAGGAGRRAERGRRRSR